MTVQVVSGTLALHGRHGDTYLIAIKGLNGKRLPLPMIEYFCKVFVAHARQRPGDQFCLNVIGGGKPSQVAPFFDYAPMNIRLPYEYLY